MRHPRTSIAALVVTAIAIAAVAAPRAMPVDAASRAPASEPAAMLPLQEEQPAQTESNKDDDLVEVQLVVLGIALFVVVGVGSAGYLLRKRLGLVPPPPDQSATGHH